MLPFLLEIKDKPNAENLEIKDEIVIKKKPGRPRK
jgi:hypothetical protein